MEFRMGSNGEWQESNTFTNLTVGTSYTFTSRMKETKTHHASPSSVSVTFKTDKHSQTTPSAPTMLSRSATSITLTADSNMEFRRDHGVWQHSNIFTGLSVGSSHTFTRRIRETTTHHASHASKSVTLTIDKQTQTTPSAPTMSSKTSTSITLTLDSTMEYRRIGSTTWQHSNIFTNLSPSTSYSFTRRRRETATHHASSESTSVTIITNNNKAVQSTPSSAPTLHCRTSTTITLTADSTMEYRRIGSGSDTTTWQHSNIFTNLLPSTSYTFTSRRRETATHDHSLESTAITFTTLAMHSIVPELTSDKSHGMVVTASSVTQWNRTLRFDAYKAFVPISQCNTADMWYSASNINERSNGWVQIDLGANNLHRITGYAVTNFPSNTLTRIRTFRLMGSTNGSAWTTLHNGSSPRDGRFTFSLANASSWRFIRLQSLSTNNVNNWTAVPYLEIFGTKV